MANHTVDCEVCGEDLRKSGISHAGCVDKDAIRKGLTYTVDAGLEWKAQAQNAEAEIARLTALVSSSERERVRSCSELLERAISAEAERDTARAETAMAFKVAKEAIAQDVMDWDEESFGESNSADETADYIRNLEIAPADATAALAARDKATREKALREAAHAGYVACAETRHVTLGNAVSEAILSLIK